MKETYSPKVINEDIKHGQQQDQDNSTPLGLEPNDDHDAGNKPKQADEHTPEAPLAGEDEADKEED